MSKTIPYSELKELFPKGKARENSNHIITTCPYCNKEKHFYINKKTQLFDCKRCGEVGNIFKLLHKLGKLFLLGEFKSIERSRIKLLSEISEENEENVYEDAEKRKMPLGFKRSFDDKYLLDRKLTKKNLKKAIVGYTNLIPSLKDYLIMAIMEDGDCKGYLARYTKKIPKDKNIPRYLNDKGAKFKNLLGGYDEIIDNVTDTVILLEGYIDKLSLDNFLQLDEQDDIKSCCTFGKKISFSQIVKLLRKGIKNVILIYDYDAIKEMKKYSLELEKYFNVKVGYTFEKDINDSTEKEVLSIFDRLQNPNEFYRKNVTKIKK